MRSIVRFFAVSAVLASALLTGCADNSQREPEGKGGSSQTPSGGNGTGAPSSGYQQPGSGQQQGSYAPPSGNQVYQPDTSTGKPNGEVRIEALSGNSFGCSSPNMVTWGPPSPANGNKPVMYSGNPMTIPTTTGWNGWIVFNEMCASTYFLGWKQGTVVSSYGVRVMYNNVDVSSRVRICLDIFNEENRKKGILLPMIGIDSNDNTCPNPT